MGSNAGLLSYDGYTIQSHFEYGKNSNVRIYCGVVAGDSIFLGADNGLLIYNYKTDHYVTAEVSFPNDVRSLAFYKNNLWIGTLNGLYRYTLDTHELKGFTPRNSHLPMTLSTPCCIHLTMNCTSVLMTGYAGWMRPAMISISSAFPPLGAKRIFLPIPCWKTKNANVYGLEQKAN